MQLIHTANSTIISSFYTECIIRSKQSSGDARGHARGHERYILHILLLLANAKNINVFLFEIVLRMKNLICRQMFASTRSLE